MAQVHTKGKMLYLWKAASKKCRSEQNEKHNAKQFPSFCSSPCPVRKNAVTFQMKHTHTFPSGDYKTLIDYQASLHCYYYYTDAGAWMGIIMFAVSFFYHPLENSENNHKSYFQELYFRFIKLCAFQHIEKVRSCIISWYNDLNYCLLKSQSIFDFIQLGI